MREDRLDNQKDLALLEPVRDDEISKERKVLEYISAGNLAWAPADNSEDAADGFDKEARRLIDSLDRLIAQGFIRNYRAHVESHSGKRRIDRVLITEGLTFKGQDKSTWPA